MNARKNTTKSTVCEQFFLIKLQERLKNIQKRSDRNEDYCKTLKAELRAAVETLKAFYSSYIFYSEMKKAAEEMNIFILLKMA